MIRRSTNERLIALALRAGVAVPFLYFGMQMAAAPFYPGYSFFSRDASTLGSEGSTHPSIFNLGSIILGMLTLVAAWGFWRALRSLNVHPALVWTTVAALVSFGLASINAGVFPLPDPRHTGGFFAILGIGSFLLPALLPAALWKLRDADRLKIFFVANIVVIVVLLPIISGLIQILLVKYGTESPNYQHFLNNYHGLLQRIAAFVLVAPIGASAYELAHRMSWRHKAPAA